MLELPSISQERVIKVIMVGGQAVGKTSVIRRYFGKPFLEEYKPTLGYDLYVKPLPSAAGPVSSAEKKVMLHLWDVSHLELEASGSHHTLICGDVAGVVMVLDAGTRESLAAVDAWHRLLSQYIPPNIPRVLLAHKADLPKTMHVVNDRVLEAFVRDAGLADFCWTVGDSRFGDYKAERGPKSKSVDEAFAMLLELLLKPPTTTTTSTHRHTRAATSPSSALLHDTFPHTLSVSTSWPSSGSSPTPASSPSALRTTYYNTRSGSIGASLDRSGGGPPLLCISSPGVSMNPFSPQLTAQTTPAAAATASHSYQPPHGWLPSEDLEDVFMRSSEAVRRGSNQKGTTRSDGSLAGGSSRRPEAAVDMADIGWIHYAGSIDRVQAEVLLKTRPVGTFLLRRRDERSLVLSYKTPNDIAHAPIVFDGTQWSKDVAQGGAPGATYPSLQDFLARHSRRAVTGLCFRRLPNTCDYVLQDQRAPRRVDGWGAGWEWLGGGRGKQSGKTGPPPEPVTFETVGEVMSELEALLLAATMLGGPETTPAAKTRTATALDLCRRSRAELLACMGAGGGGGGGERERERDGGGGDVDVSALGPRELVKRMTSLGERLGRMAVVPPEDGEVEGGSGPAAKRARKRLITVCGELRSWCQYLDTLRMKLEAVVMR